MEADVMSSTRPAIHRWPCRGLLGPPKQGILKSRATIRRFGPGPRRSPFPTEDPTTDIAHVAAALSSATPWHVHGTSAAVRGRSPESKNAL
jgi:hypothetical protein